MKKSPKDMVGAELREYMLNLPPEELVRLALQRRKYEKAILEQEQCLELANQIQNEGAKKL